jgi:hypothetical protein
MGISAAVVAGVTVLGYLESGKQARKEGERRQAAAEFAAWQAEEQAGTAIAISQREAKEAQRLGDIEASRALAVAAASGGGVSDPTIVRVLANVKGESAYRANVALYEGEARARQLRLDAAAGRVSGAYAKEEGLARQRSYQLAAVGSAFSSGASLYTRYGMNGPSGGSGDAALIRED